MIPGSYLQSRNRGEELAKERRGFSTKTTRKSMVTPTNLGTKESHLAALAKRLRQQLISLLRLRCSKKATDDQMPALLRPSFMVFPDTKLGTLDLPLAAVVTAGGRAKPCRSTGLFLCETLGLPIYRSLLPNSAFSMEEQV